MKNSGFRYIWIGHAAFIVIFILSSLFYLERVIFVDASGFAFRLIYDHNFQYTTPRFVSVIPQILPLTGVWLHLPLKAILFLFSISYVLLFYSVFLITAYVLKQKRLALSIPFILLLGSQFSFYWCVSESFQANVYTVLLAAFLYYSKGMKNDFRNSVLKFFIAGLIIFLTYFTHPVAFFPLLFVLVFFMIDQKRWRDPLIYILISFLLIMLVAVVFVFSPNEYDAERYNMFFAFYNKLGNLFTSETLKFINLHIFNIYLFSWLIFGITCFYYIWKKLFLKFVFYFGSVIIFLLIISLTFDYFNADFIQEKNVNSINVILLLPFFHEVIYDKIKFRIPSIVFLLTFLIFYSVLIVLAYPFNANRLSYIKHLLELTTKFPEKKFIMEEKDVDQNTVLMTWAFSTETLLLSSLESPDSSRTIYVPTREETIFVDITDPGRYMCARWAPDLRIEKMGNLFNLGNNLGYRKISAVDLLNSGITIYNEDFEEQGRDTINIRHDSTGNTCFLLTDVYSPGFADSIHKLTSAGKIYLEATARIKPFEDISPERFSLSISRINNGQGYDIYYSCIPDRCFFPKGKWTEVRVSGMVAHTDDNDILKVFIWNPDKVRVLIDDLKVVLYQDK